MKILLLEKSSVSYAEKIINIHMRTDPLIFKGMGCAISNSNTYCFVMLL